MAVSVTGHMEDNLGFEEACWKGVRTMGCVIGFGRSYNLGSCYCRHNAMGINLVGFYYSTFAIYLK